MAKYVLFTDKFQKVTKKERELIQCMYEARFHAAKLFKFDKDAGFKIRELRQKLALIKRPTYTIENPKYKINLPYHPTPEQRINVLKTYKYEIHKKRKELREIQSHLSETGFDSIQKIHIKPNGVFNWFYQKMLVDLKTPTSEASFIGVEFECGIPATFDYSLFKPLAKKISLGNDSSIRNLPVDYIPKEFRLLTTTKDYKKDITSVLTILNNQKAVVNDTCGLHVHLDMRKYLEAETRDKITTIFTNLVKSQKYLQGLVHADRVYNDYCRPNTKTDPFYSPNRYRAINSQALGRHKTIEVRLHHGSLDITEVINWVTLLLGIVNGGEINRAPVTIDAWLNKVDVEAEVKAYIKSKYVVHPSRRASTYCELDHDGENCRYCGGSWEDHEGHDCLDENGDTTDQRGQFPNCERS